MSEQEQADAIKAAFAKKRQFQRLLTIPLLLFIAVWVVLDETGGSDTMSGTWTLALGVVMIVSTMVVIYYSLRNWRCPACNKRLPPEGAFFQPLDKCLKCGAKLS